MAKSSQPIKVFYQTMVWKREKRFKKFLKDVLKMMSTYHYNQIFPIYISDYNRNRLFNAIVALDVRRFGDSTKYILE